MKIQSFILIGLVALFIGCSKFLDMKPDSSISTPTKLRDLELLLQNSSSLMNNYSAGIGELLTDDITFTDENWRSMSETSRNLYLFKKDYPVLSHWNGGYNQVMYANTVLDYIDKMNDSRENVDLRNNLKGRALFHRAYAFFDLLQNFSVPYNKLTSKSDLGIVLRLSADNQIKSVRSSVEECYNQIISDLNEAEKLLSSVIKHPTIPSKAAVYGLLARVYLQLNNPVQASERAEDALEHYRKIMDFNAVSITNTIPFQIYNEEIIYHTCINGGDFLLPSRFQASQGLIKLYEDKDLRKQLFYTQKADGSLIFKGNYYGNTTSSILFSGITVPELLLIKAEGLIVKNEIIEATNVINELRKKRFNDQDFVAVEFNSIDDASDFLADERRRELAFRGLRWLDLRRKSTTSTESILIKHNIENIDHLFKGNQIRQYAFLIPEMVVNNSSIVQN